jgi:Lar family restriction alleviation protein
MDQETKPCPFCGSDNISDGEMLSSDADGGNRAVQSECLDCGAVGPKGWLADGEIDYGCVKAIAAWNRRAP